MSRKNYKDRVLNTELISDVNTRGVVIQLDRRINNLERNKDVANSAMSEACDNQVITDASGLTLIPKLRVSLTTHGGPVELGFKVNLPPDPISFSISGASGVYGLTLQFYRDDTYIDSVLYSYTESGSANTVTETVLLPRFTDLNCPTGSHVWTVKAGVTGTFTIRGIQLYAYEVIG